MPDKLIIPENYKPALNIRNTEVAIKQIKDCFERELAKELNLTRVSAPLFVLPETGLNDNLNGVERAVGFDIKDLNGKSAEIVHSLAKWKRMALKRYGFGCGEGLYTDMNAIRRDEMMDNLHSIYVDQWDWESVISKEERTLENLMVIVAKIYEVFKKTEKLVCEIYPQLKSKLPDEIHFLTSQELEDRYPQLSPKEREDEAARLYKAVFIMKIGGPLKSGFIHDGRAPDYDDWELNGDIVFWYPVLERAFEVSSMGIRVDEESMLKQLSITGCRERASLKYHADLLEGKLPYTVGGGIGQSRICMFFLEKGHIGEVQSSVWPDEMIEICSGAEMMLL